VGRLERGKWAPVVIEWLPGFEVSGAFAFFWGIRDGEVQVNFCANSASAAMASGPLSFS